MLLKVQFSVFQFSSCNNKADLQAHTDPVSPQTSHMASIELQVTAHHVLYTLIFYLFYTFSNKLQKKKLGYCRADTVCCMLKEDSPGRHRGTGASAIECVQLGGGA